MHTFPNTRLDIITLTFIQTMLWVKLTESHPIIHPHTPCRCVSWIPRRRKTPQWVNAHKNLKGDIRGRGYIHRSTWLVLTVDMAQVTRKNLFSQKVRSQHLGSHQRDRWTDFSNGVPFKKDWKVRQYTTQRSSNVWNVGQMLCVYSWRDRKRCHCCPFMSPIFIGISL